MSRHADRKLLYLLLLLVSLSPLRGFAMPQMRAAMSECAQRQAVGIHRQAHRQATQAVCEHCQAPACDDVQCNMALCGAFHTPASFLVIAGISPLQRVETAPVSRPAERLPDHTEPPLIRPPIAFPG